MESLTETTFKMIETALDAIKEPLKKKKPNVKEALWRIDRIRSICEETRENSAEPKEQARDVTKTVVHSYKCLYQCGFTTRSIREIDEHLTKVHGHPDPHRDYNSRIYNE